MARPTHMIPVVAIALHALCHAEPSRAESIYMIGNSFTHNSQPYSLPALAQQQGVELSVGAHIKSGSPVHNIWANPKNAREVSETYGKYPDALTKHQWDAVTLSDATWTDMNHAILIGTSGSERAVVELKIYNQNNYQNMDARFGTSGNWFRIPPGTCWVERAIDRQGAFVIDSDNKLQVRALDATAGATVLARVSYRYLKGYLDLGAYLRG